MFATTWSRLHVKNVKKMLLWKWSRPAPFEAWMYWTSGAAVDSCPRWDSRLPHRTKYILKWRCPQSLAGFWASTLPSLIFASRLRYIHANADSLFSPSSSPGCSLTYRNTSVEELNNDQKFDVVVCTMFHGGLWTRRSFLVTCAELVKDILNQTSTLSTLPMVCALPSVRRPSKFSCSFKGWLSGWVDLISRVSASTPSWDSLGPCRGCLISACARFGSHIWLGVVLKSFGLILQLDDVDKRRFQEQLVDAAQSLLTHLAAATWPCWRHATSLNRLYRHLLP